MRLSVEILRMIDVHGYLSFIEFDFALATIRRASKASSDFPDYGDYLKFL